MLTCVPVPTTVVVEASAKPAAQRFEWEFNSEYLTENEKQPPQYSHHGRAHNSQHSEKIGIRAVVFSRKNGNLQDFFSEFFGTFIMVLFGDGVVAQVVLSKETRGDYQSINWAWGYVSSSISLAFIYDNLTPILWTASF